MHVCCLYVHFFKQCFHCDFNHNTKVQIHVTLHTQPHVRSDVSQVTHTLNETNTKQNEYGYAYLRV